METSLKNRSAFLSVIVFGAVSLGVLGDAAFASSSTVCYGVLGTSKGTKTITVPWSVACNNSLPGGPGDVAPNQTKQCVLTTAASGFSVTGAGPWREGSTISGTLPLSIEYKSSDLMSCKSFVQGTRVYCDNNHFGDPASRVVKHCYAATAAGTADSNQVLASENQSFVLAGAPDCAKVDVYYAAINTSGNPQFNKKTYCSGTHISCSNPVFGDVGYGRQKACYVGVSSLTTTVGASNASGILSSVPSSLTVIGVEGSYPFVPGNQACVCTVNGTKIPVSEANSGSTQ